MGSPKKISISGLELTIIPEGEILKMGGPWIGEILIGTDLISKDCLIDNLVYKTGDHLLFFVKYHVESKYAWHFSINFYNLSTNALYEFDKTFDMLFLGKFISNNELEIFRAFHDQFQNKKEIFNLDHEEFFQIN